MCDCEQKNTSMEEGSAMALAMAYVPWQQFHKTYEPQKALMAGTIFPELDKPFSGRNGGQMR